MPLTTLIKMTPNSVFFFPFPSPIYSFFFNWIFYLFDFQIVFPFQVYSLQIPDAIPLILLLWGCSHTSYPLLPHYHCILLHWGIKPPQYEGTPLPLMPGEDISAFSVHPLTPPLGSLCSVWWLIVSIHICIDQDLAEHVRRQLYHFISCQQAVLGIYNSVWLWGPHGGWMPKLGSLFMASPSVSASFFVSVFPLDRSNSGLQF